MAQPLVTDSAEALGSLSPSRAADFKTCPLLYRFRTIDRLPEAPSRVATRGTVVHAVLERLFDLPAAERTLDRARALVPAAWQRMREPSRPSPNCSPPTATATELGRVAGLGRRSCWATTSRSRTPTALEPAAREELVEVVVDGLRLRGYVDRLDVVAGRRPARRRLQDRRTPREAFEAKALFQMKFYALVLWRTRGVVPRQLRLIYLADTDTLSYAPDADELERVRAHAARDLGRDRAGHADRRLPAAARAGCAGGATTRRTVRPSAARRRRTRSAEERAAAQRPSGGRDGPRRADGTLAARCGRDADRSHSARRLSFRTDEARVAPRAAAVASRR